MFFIHTWVIDENFKEKTNAQIISKGIIQDFLAQLWMHVNWDKVSQGKWGRGLVEEVCEKETKVQYLKSKTAPNGFYSFFKHPVEGSSKLYSFLYYS